MAKSFLMPDGACRWCSHFWDRFHDEPDAEGYRLCQRCGTRCPVPEPDPFTPSERTFYEKWDPGRLPPRKEAIRPPPKHGCWVVCYTCGYGPVHPDFLDRHDGHDLGPPSAATRASP